MLPGKSLDQHHFIPRSQGGRDKQFVHRICHRKLHSLFTEKELARDYATPQAIHAQPEMALFIKWVRRKPPEFIDGSRTARRKRV